MKHRWTEYLHKVCAPNAYYWCISCALKYFVTRRPSACSIYLYSLIRIFFTLTKPGRYVDEVIGCY